MALIKVVVPDLGLCGGKAIVVAWRVPNGSAVRCAESIVDLEGDNCILEIGAPGSGVVRQAAKVGQVVGIGELIGDIDDSIMAAAILEDGDGVPSAHRALLSLLLASGKEYTEALRGVFESSSEPFDQATACFEVAVYMAFRSSYSLRLNPKAWEDLSLLFMEGTVEAHREHILCDDLGGVFERRVDSYCSCWNDCVDRKTYPALSCVQLLRTHILGAARTGRIEAKAPLNMDDGFMTEFHATPALVEIDCKCAGKLDCILKHVMLLSEDIRSLTGQEIWTAAVRGIAEAGQINANLSAPYSVSNRRRKHRWKFWA